MVTQIRLILCHIDHFVTVVNHGTPDKYTRQLQSLESVRDGSFQKHIANTQALHVFRLTSDLWNRR